MNSRQEQFSKLFPQQPRFRWEQIQRAFFDPKINGWDEISSLPKQMRDALVGTAQGLSLQNRIPWMTCRDRIILRSKTGDTYKAALELYDGKLVETVLMQNSREQWTVCVSSQVGCAMACSFCATGKMGLLRSLTGDEIVDQYRFWMYWLSARPDLPQRISNVVFMGMGEPMANYERVKTALNTWLKYTDLGPTHITVSTVGVLPMMEKLLADKDWPHTRLAVSLHSADKTTRKNIVRTSSDAFLPALTDWSKRYLKKYGNRRHYLTFEHVMLAGVNDTEEHAKQLTNFANRIGDVHINLIPWNTVADTPFAQSQEKQLEIFSQTLKKRGVSVTVRRNMGTDIAAACGQLANEGTRM